MASAPIKLYKYATVDGALQLLMHQSLKFTPLLEYNDPFEGENAYRLTCDSNGKVCVIDSEGMLRTLNHSPDLQSVQQARRQIRNSAACCFCARSDSVILWAHYADQHKGVCLEFEFPRFTTGFGVFEDVQDGRGMHFGEVDYSKRRPDVLANTDDRSIVPYEMIERSIFTKSLDWAYEEEWRFVKRGASEVTYEKFSKSRLKRVVLGLRTTEPDKEAIRGIVSSNYDAVVVAQARKHQFEYAVEIVSDGAT